MYNLCMYYEKQKSYDKTELTFQPTLVFFNGLPFVGLMSRNNNYQCLNLDYVFTVHVLYTGFLQAPGFPGVLKNSWNLDLLFLLLPTASHFAYFV